MNQTTAAIPNFLRSPSDKFTVAVAGQVASPAPMSEVERELSQLHMELGDLESIATDLGLRLKPVLHANPDIGVGAGAANCSSAVGQQISASAYRVATLSACLRTLISNLAV